MPATIDGPVRPARAGKFEALELDGRNVTVLVTDKLKEAGLPNRAISAEAWVRVDKTQDWGGIVGAIQDDGEVEHGWLLGYRGDRFSFALASEGGKGKLTYATSNKAIQPGAWAHVAGVYDGKTMKLFVNGNLVAGSNAQSGNIEYPEQGFYAIGAYQDTNEHHPMQGAIHEVRVYDRALTPTQIVRHAQTETQRATGACHTRTEKPSLRCRSRSLAQILGPRVCRRPMEDRQACKVHIASSVRW